MDAITILWNDPESAGYMDVIPIRWFSKMGHRRDVIHSIRGPREGLSEAKCDVEVYDNYADLNYQCHAEFNDKRGMYRGIMRLHFRDANRQDATKVEWKEEGDSQFRACDTDIDKDQIERGIGGLDLDLLNTPRTEGSARFVSHLAYERDARLVAQKKSAVLAATGTLACEACGFSFEKRYKLLGEGYCEVHHRAPLAKGGARETALNDLAILCSNCHRMIHRSGDPMLSVEDFSKAWIIGGSPALVRK